MASEVRARYRAPPKSLRPDPETQGGGASGRRREPNETRGDYEVGYGKPPEHTRFRKGESGNPKGRPKGSKNLKTELAEELQERVAVKEGGRRCEVSKQRAMIKSLMARALQGDARAATLIINMVARFLDQTEENDLEAPLSADDLAILERFKAKVRGEYGKRKRL